MIPRIIHQTAPTKILSWEEERLAERLRGVLRGWEYRLWDDSDNQRLIGNTFPQFADTFSSITRGVVKADIARYVFLYVHGGFYFDTDYKIYKPIEDDILSHACVLPVSRDPDGDGVFRLGNAILGSVPGHAFWSDFVEHLFADSGLSAIQENRVEATTGPEGLTDFYVAHKDRYANAHLPARRLFHPEVTLSSPAKDAYGVHLCFGSWRSGNLLRNLKNFVTRKVAPLL